VIRSWLLVSNVFQALMRTERRQPAKASVVPLAQAPFLAFDEDGSRQSAGDWMRRLLEEVRLVSKDQLTGAGEQDSASTVQSSASRKRRNGALPDFRST